MIVVEYLLPFNTEDGICKDTGSFNSLLESNSEIKIKKGKITYSGSTYSYSVDLTEVQNQDCSVFHVSFSVSRLTDKFRKMLKAFRKTVGPHMQDNIQIIWDGVSFEWGKELYPAIYQVENLMRKLISKFMLVNLGIGWHKSTIPADVKNSIKKQNYKPTHAILYEVDLIQLANFLFKPYSVKDSAKLPDVVAEIIKNQEINDETKDKLEDYIPKNNWDRYFSKIVDLESEELKKMWERLYDVRCKVAHNKLMNISDFEIANDLCDKLNDILTNAMDKLIEIEIPDDEKEDISLNSLGSFSNEIRTFADDYLNLSSEISSHFLNDENKMGYLKDLNRPISSLLASEHEGNILLNDDLKTRFWEIENSKNYLLGGDNLKLGDLKNRSELFNFESDYFKSIVDENNNLRFFKDSTINDIDDEDE